MGFNIIAVIYIQIVQYSTDCTTSFFFSNVIFSQYDLQRNLFLLSKQKLTKILSHSANFVYCELTNSIIFSNGSLRCC